MLAGTSVDLAVALDLILADPTGYRRDAIAPTAKGSSNDIIQQSQLGNPFWQGLGDQMQIVVSGLLRPYTIAALERAIFNPKDPERTKVISDGHLVLESAAA